MVVEETDLGGGGGGCYCEVVTIHTDSDRY
jgi:hypothetical protein